MMKTGSSVHSVGVNIGDGNFSDDRPVWSVIKASLEQTKVAEDIHLESASSSFGSAPLKASSRSRGNDTVGRYFCRHSYVGECVCPGNSASGIRDRQQICS